MSNGNGVPGNITATFGADLHINGSTSIPNLLLKFYKKLGMSDSEMMLLIQLFYLRTTCQKYYPSIEEISDVMTADYYKIQGDLVTLMEKKFLTVGQFYDEINDQVRNVYEFDLLFEKISELWALERMQFFQRQQELLSKREDIFEKFEMDELSLIYKTFEREFGRLLSPMEIEVIRGWLIDDQQPVEVISEALKKAVLLGKHNFKYIDSILLEWKKNNLRTIESIRSYDENYKQRRNSAQNPSKNQGLLANNEKKAQESIKEKRDKFKLLYMS